MEFSIEVINKVWDKGGYALGRNPAEWREDVHGALISWREYGNRSSVYGWEIDHIRPRAEGGGDETSNLRPLQWENNVRRRPRSLLANALRWTP